MRSDVTLYVVAIFFFALALISAIISTGAERILWVTSTAVLGILSVGLGYSQRPKTKSSIQKTQTPTVTSTPTESSTQQAPSQKEEKPIEQVAPTESSPVEITQTTTEPTKETTPLIEAAAEQPIPQEQTPTETTQPKVAPIQVEQEETSPLTNVKGIGEKRAAQLSSLGINTVKELSQASVEDLAKNLKISPKIVAKWVEAAKQQ
ncbi:MAG: helix-hairpin-helix domain-containing protein [Candidatus Bathyarchaeota archaeon]|nr:helix-hairpin-helix domain-containing protein [Candidatus Termiticorpusculum sp.]